MINPTFSSGSLCNRKHVEEERKQEMIYKELKLYGQCLALKPSGRSIYSLFSSIIWTCWISGIYVQYTYTHIILFLINFLVGKCTLGCMPRAQDPNGLPVFPPELTLSTWCRAKNPCSSDLITSQQPQRKEAELLVHLAINLPWTEACVKWGEKVTSFSSTFLSGQEFLLYGPALPILITRTFSFYLCYLVKRILLISKCIQIIYSYPTSVDYGFG